MSHRLPVYTVNLNQKKKKGFAVSHSFCVGTAKLVLFYLVFSLAGGLANGVGNINNPTSSQGHAPQLHGVGGSVSTEENSSTSKSDNKTSSTSSATIDNKTAGGQFASGPGSRPSSSSHGRASGSRPSSSYSSRSQQLGGPQKGSYPCSLTHSITFIRHLLEGLMFY